MKHGVLLTTLKANARVRLGSGLGHPRQKNFASKSRASKPCYWLFSIPEGSSIKNLSQLGKQFMLTFMKMFWIVSSKELNKFVLVCARLEIGFFSMTTHRPIMRNQFISFWPKKYYCPSSPSLFGGFGSSRLFLIPEIKITIKRKAFWRCSNHKEKRDQSSKGHSGNRL